MTFKIFVALTLVAVVSAAYIPAQQVYQAPPKAIAVAQPVYAKAEESYDPHPKYQFAYSVHDEHTGDVKNQVESRDGDLVQGEYSLIDSDGYKRVVKYTADHEHGFNAIVEREPLKYAVKETPVIKAAPLAYVKSAPVAYANAPVYKSATLSYGPASNQQASYGSYSAPESYSDSSDYSYTKY